MAEYIDKEYIDKEALCLWCLETGPSYCDQCVMNREGIPAADVRPVVRKPVVGYEGLYFVSDDGKVTNADGAVMKQHVKMGCGTCYKRVSLYKDGQYKSRYVHRFVKAVPEVQRS